MDNVFKALAHPIRREVLSLLKKRAHSAGDLAAHFDVAKPTLSGHLNLLKQADLVSVERKGTTLLYRLNMSIAEEVVGHLLTLLNVEDEEKTQQGGRDD